MTRAERMVYAGILAVVAYAALSIASELHLANDRRLITYCSRVLR